MKRRSRSIDYCVFCFYGVLLHLHTERADHLLFPCRERARTGTKAKKKKAA